MNTIKVSIKDKLAIISLDRGKSNALNRQMLVELTDMLENIAANDNVRGAIITGKEHFFSAGLDLFELYDYNQEESRSFWELFLQFTANIISFKKPLVSAVNGHSPAGGCVIALACDARIMAEGQYFIGLNEVPMGIIVPNSIFQLYAFWLGKAAAYRHLLAGTLFSPREALELNLVDEVVKPESILTFAERSIRKMMALEPNTWQQSKINLRKELIAACRANQNEELEKMQKQWWSPNTRVLLNQIINTLKSKKES